MVKRPRRDARRRSDLLGTATADTPADHGIHATQLPARRVRLTVSDTGTGMDAGDHLRR